VLGILIGYFWAKITWRKKLEQHLYLGLHLDVLPNRNPEPDQNRPGPGIVYSLFKKQTFLLIINIKIFQIGEKCHPSNA
jgi:hypothetical protein